MSPTLVRLVLDLALVVDVSEEGVVGKVVLSCVILHCDLLGM